MDSPGGVDPSVLDVDRVALGEALRSRAAEVGAAVAAALWGNGGPAGPVESMVADLVVRDCTWSTTQMGSYLCTGEIATSAGRRNLAARGKTLVDGTMSMADVTKSYLLWRDTALRVVHEEVAGRRLRPEVLALAEQAIRHSCDAALVGMVRQYDIGRQDLQCQLAAEHEKLRHQALHDPLTGLANRMLLMDRLEHALERTDRQPDPVAVLYLDLDGFKEINDGRGHDVGDQVLVEVAQRLLGLVRSSDTVARLGGDEFVILCEQMPGGRELADLADRVRAAVADPMPACPGLRVSVTVGAVLSEPGSDRDATLRAADEAMYAAKHGRTASGGLATACATRLAPAAS